MSRPGARPLHRLVAAGAGMLASVVAACTFLRPLDYLTSGMDGATVSDAAEAADGASATDQHTDDAESSPGGTWCMQQQPVPFFCTDFDEAQLTSAYESGVLVMIPGPTVGPGGSASIGTSTDSPPGNFITYAPGTADGGSLDVRYEQPVDAPMASTARLRFDLQLLMLTVGQEVDFASLYMYPADGGPPARLFVSIQPSGGGTIFVDNGTTGENQPFAIPANGMWHTYELELELGPTLRASLYVDSATTAVASVTDLTVPFSVAQPTNFYLGASVFGPSAPVQLAYDNVVLTVQ